MKPQTTDDIALTISDRERYRKALVRITLIEDKLDGGDWDEIIEARAVAREALCQKNQ